MTTFVDFPGTVTAATLSGSNGIGVTVQTGIPNKIIVSASNVPNSSLQNSAIKINETVISLGSTGSISVGGGGGGSGTVNTGSAGYIAYYPSNGTTVDDTTKIYTDGTIVSINTSTPASTAKVTIAGSNTDSSFSTGIPTLQLEDTGGSAQTLLRIRAGTTQGGVRADFAGNFSWHNGATTSHHGFYGDNSITYPLMTMGAPSGISRVTIGREPGTIDTSARLVVRGASGEKIQAWQTNAGTEVVSISSTGGITATSFTGNGSGLTNLSVVTVNTGSVNSGSSGYFAYYPTTGIAVSGSTVLYTNGTNIGVGTASPTVKLDVNGEAKINGLNLGKGTPARNTRFGDSTLSGTTQTDNTAIGYYAGKNITDGDSNTAVGAYSLYSVTSGYVNSAFGYYAGYGYTTGFENVCIGRQADDQASSGYSNTSVGAISRYGSTSGNENTCVGYYSRTLNYSNCTALGNNSVVNGNNQVQLGSSTTTTYAYGAVQDRSDARDKTDIEDSNLDINFISKLRPVSFKWDYREDYEITEKEEKEFINENGEKETKTELKTTVLPKDGSKKRTRKHYGFIAQEVKQAMDDLGVDFGGYQDHSIKGGNDILSIGYQELIAPMVKSIQQLKTENDDLKQKLNDVLSRLSALENK